MGHALRTGFLLAVMLCPTMGMAEVYKWVDQNGVTHYSNKPPTGAVAKKPEVIDERVSTYSPIAPAEKTRDTKAESAERANAEKIDRLQRQLDTERRAREQAAEDARRTAELEKQRQQEKCLAERRVDCNESVASQRQVFVPVLPRRNTPVTQPPFTPTSPITGVTAGNVTNTLINNGASVDRTPGAFPAKK